MLTVSVNWSLGPVGPGWFLLFGRVTASSVSNVIYGGLWDGRFEVEYRGDKPQDDGEIEMVILSTLLGEL